MDEQKFVVWCKDDRSYFDKRKAKLITRMSGVRSIEHHWDDRLAGEIRERDKGRREEGWAGGGNWDRRTREGDRSEQNEISDDKTKLDERSEPATHCNPFF